MEEMADNARVWRVGNDETNRIDAQAVEGWLSFLDTLLIFVRILKKLHLKRYLDLIIRPVFSQRSWLHLLRRQHNHCSRIILW